MLRLGDENPPARESEALREIERIIRNRFQGNMPQPDSLARRDAHAKSHGCVSAEFIVGDDLDDSLRHGIFRAPRTYQAWIRFSSGALQVQSDTIRGVHGMAIKLLGVEGDKILTQERTERTQDFLMANNEVFFVRNALDYLDFTACLEAGRLPRFFLDWNPTRWRLKELLIASLATYKRVASPLEVQYWSQTPYKLGDSAMKFTARPSSARIAKPSSQSENYLEEAMARRLTRDDFWFDFLVQRQVNPFTMPIEDATVAWDRSLSPLRKVASVRIPRQEFVFAKRKMFDESLSYTPWHALPDHRPLGGINRARREVYTSISILRHLHNGARREEPSSNTIC